MLNPAPITITLNGVDVTDCYWPKAGAIEITDNLNQPVTTSLAFLSSKLPAPIAGGELLTVQDAKQIYFDGVIPVEAGVGTDFLYLDSEAKPKEVYRKMVKVTATDYQSVLDFANLPDRTFYDTKSGDIIKTLIDLSPLAGLVDYSLISDGYVIPMYFVGGRKFSNVAKELASVNGFYFSLFTSAITGEAPDLTRQFVAEFRGLTSRPAPFAIDRDAYKYRLNTLRFDPRDKPLINKVTIVGGVEPSEDIQVDEFLCDDDSGQFLLSKVPFSLKTSELFTADFSQDLETLDGVVLHNYTPTAFASGSLNGNELQIVGQGDMSFVPSFQSREQRYVTWEEIRLDAGASIVCGISGTATPTGGADIKLGVWFKPDGTISFIYNGAEGTPKGNPTWKPRSNADEVNIYSVRVKQTPDGTMCEVQGGDLSPVRHWFPLLPPGDHAEADLTFRGVPHIGATIDLVISGVKVPTYVLDADDAADSTLWTLHEHLARWIGSVDAIYRRWWVTEQSDYWTFASLTKANPVVATLNEDSDIQTGDWVEVCGLDKTVWAAVNGNGTRYKAERIDARHIKIVGLNGLDLPNPPVGVGWFRHYHNGLYIYAFKDGSQDNLGIAATIDPNNRLSDGTYLEPIEQWLNFDFDATEGTDRGADFASLPDRYYACVLAHGGTGTIKRIIARDPVGVDVQLQRTEEHVLQILGADANPDLVEAQMTVNLTVGSKDEVAEAFSAQCTLEGNTAVLSFFDDEASLPQAGDIVRVAYRYGVPIRVQVQDHTSIEMVKAKSCVPGDTGIREGQDIDLKDKVFSSESAIRYGTQYLETRSGLSLQGSVTTDTALTLGAVPKSGQTLLFAMTPDGLSRTEVVSTVAARHSGFMNMFEFGVTFGKIPDEFLLPTENPNIRNGPDAYTYNVQAVVEQVRMVDEEIKFTVV